MRVYWVFYLSLWDPCEINKTVFIYPASRTASFSETGSDRVWKCEPGHAVSNAEDKIPAGNPVLFPGCTPFLQPRQIGCVRVFGLIHTLGGEDVGIPPFLDFAMTIRK